MMLNMDAPVIIYLIIFACVFGGALLGVYLRGVLPEEHLSGDSKDTVRLGMGLVGTMAALVLGLLVASAKNFYDTQTSELIQMSAKIVLLDRVLAHYGPETKEARDLLRSAVARAVDKLWSKGRRQLLQTQPGEIIYNKIQELSPKNDAQRSFQAQASNLAIDIGKARWLMFEQRGSFHFRASALGAGFVASYYFYQLRTLCASECNCYGYPIRVRAIGFSCDFSDPGDVHAFPRNDADFQLADA